MDYDIIDILEDLHKQATRECSHYYVGTVLTLAMQEINALRAGRNSGQLDAIVRRANELKLDRYIIAKDENGFYLRETLCVIHRAELGEVHYHTKPIELSANNGAALPIRI